MQPTSVPVNQQALAGVWQTFMGGSQLSPTQQELLDPVIRLSWQRCLPRLNPFSTPRPAPVRPHAFAALLRTQSELISITTPLIEDIYQIIDGTGCAIFIVDGSGCNLAMAGDAQALEMIDHLGLGQGAYWSEGRIGTNAPGIAMISAMPVMVAGAEHYCATYHPYFGSAAPIHDIRGRIVGAISMCGPVEALNPYMMALVMSAASAISNRIQADWSLQEANHRLSEVNTVLSAISEGVIAWSTGGEIHHVNEQACELLGLNATSVMGYQIDEVLQLPSVIAGAVNGGHELRNQEVNFQVDGRTVRTLVTLRTIKDTAGEPATYITLLRPIEQVRRLVQQQAGTRATLTIDDVHGQAPSIRQTLRQARIAARGTAPVLLRGEGGVGKNHLAQAIHNDGPRAAQPFLSINCRAIPHELMVAELLGEEENIHVRPSKFELAEGGTLFLDQVDMLSLEMQAAVLQVIETGHLLHLGGTQPVPVDVRIIAATSRNLEKLVADGSFLPHLFYRFGVFNIHLPPLRERTEDIPVLAERFLSRITRRDGRAVWIEDEAVDILRRYPWPGNVRELESVLERAVHQSQDGMVRPADLPESIRQRRVMTGAQPTTQPVLTVPEAEREAIIRAGWACNGRVTEMARQLQIGRTTLWRKMKRHNISPDQFK
ncbi:MAG: dihydroxyacetone kinase operon transcriptional regulator DhaR [Candidatus Promineifilaceae bacterium]